MTKKRHHRDEFQYGMLYGGYGGGAFIAPQTPDVIGPLDLDKEAGSYSEHNNQYNTGDLAEDAGMTGVTGNSTGGDSSDGGAAGGGASAGASTS